MRWTEAEYVYRPTAFDVTDVTELHDAIAASGPAHLVSSTDGGLTGSVVPLLLDRDRGPHGSLVGHLARANGHWRNATAGVESLAIFAGPDAYISPSWYATKQDRQGRADMELRSGPRLRRARRPR